MQYNVLEARNQLSKLIDAAMRGEEVVIAKRGKPVVKLEAVPDEGVIEEVPGNPEWIAQWFRDFPIEKNWMITSEEAQADLAREREAWD